MSLKFYINSVVLCLTLMCYLTEHQHTDKKTFSEVLYSGILALFFLIQFFFSKKRSGKLASGHLDKRNAELYQNIAFTVFMICHDNPISVNFIIQVKATIMKHSIKKRMRSFSHLVISLQDSSH